MKQLLIFFLMAGMGVPARAQQGAHSMLKLRLSDGAPLSVNINGQFINRNTSILRLDGLEAGQHKVEVYRNRANNRRPKRIFTGTISLDPGMVYVGLVDIGTQRLRIKTRPYDASRDGEGVRTGNQDAASPDAVGEGYGSFPQGRDAEVSKAPDFRANPEPPGVVPATRLAALEKQVMIRKTDGERVSVLKSNLVNARVSVAQLNTILGWLSFESSRLELTDWVRSRTADPENLGQLEYRFSLEANKAAFRKQLGN